MGGLCLTPKQAQHRLAFEAKQARCLFYSYLPFRLRGRLRLN